jgi:hypothetical protein
LRQRRRIGQEHELAMQRRTGSLHAERRVDAEDHVAVAMEVEVRVVSTAPAIVGHQARIEGTSIIPMKSESAVR